jgi:hypothetical protein
VFGGPAVYGAFEDPATASPLTAPANGSALKFSVLQKGVNESGGDAQHLCSLLGADFLVVV